MGGMGYMSALCLPKAWVLSILRYFQDRGYEAVVVRFAWLVMCTVGSRHLAYSSLRKCSQRMQFSRAKRARNTSTIILTHGSLIPADVIYNMLFSHRRGKDRAI